MEDLDLTPVPEIRFNQGPSSHANCSEHIKMITAVTQVNTKMEGYMKTTNDTLDTIQEDISEIKDSLTERRIFEAKTDTRLIAIEKQGDKTMATMDTIANKLNTHMIKTAGGIAAGVGGGGGILFLIYELLGGK